MAIRTAWPVPRCGSCTTVVTGQPAVIKVGLDVVATMADHHDRALSIERGACGKYVAEERSPGETVQNLRASLTSSGCPRRRPGPRPQMAGEESPRTKPPECRRTDRSRSVLPGCAIGLVNRHTEPIPTACSTQLPGRVEERGPLESAGAGGLGLEPRLQGSKGLRAADYPIPHLGTCPAYRRPPDARLGAVAGGRAPRPPRPDSAGRPPRARLPGWLRRRKLRWRNPNVRGVRP